MFDPSGWWFDFGRGRTARLSDERLPPRKVYSNTRLAIAAGQGI
jgi:hypothetical protein